MSHVTYTVVEHDGGWAYKLGDVFSETFASKDPRTPPPPERPANRELPARAPRSNTKTAPEIGTMNTPKGAIAPMRT